MQQWYSSLRSPAVISPGRPCLLMEASQQVRRALSHRSSPPIRRSRSIVQGVGIMSSIPFRRGILAASLSLFFLSLVSAMPPAEAQKPLQIYFVDVEGG